ncbi:nuclear transport factor 2 family protein [Lentzea sp. E54]|uniref:nuclear transport factor 2 family protein n=1 Tax=Lentzea xerophila TaxID=3435883 RepID=UPI003DA412E6
MSLEEKVVEQLRHVENGEWDQAWAMYADTATVWKHNELELTLAEASSRASAQDGMVASLKYNIIRQISEGDDVLTQLDIEVDQDYGEGTMRGNVHAVFYFRFENGLIVRNEQYANFIPISTGTVDGELKARTGEDA